MKVVGIIVATILVVATLFFTCVPAGRAMWNNWWHDVEKVDDKTSYENRKKVEDTCRAMMASYEADRLVYEQYKNSDNEEKQGWAEQAKMRANKTASSYNNYVRKNSYVWDGNVPSDIDYSLPYIE